MKLYVAFFVLTAFLGVALSDILPEVGKQDPKFVFRAAWGAKPPKFTTPLRTPVMNVIIHHSYIPGACTSESDCEAAMRSIQNSHQNDNGMTDIAYNFGVGGDGRVYEGTGYTIVGNHTRGYDDRSFGIVLIGDWTSEVPPASQIDAVQNLLRYSVSVGRLSYNYSLIGHRQPVKTDCPGDALYEEIKTWPNYTPFR